MTAPQPPHIEPYPIVPVPFGQIVTYITQNGKYRIMIERAANTKGIDGFKVEANGDIMGEVEADVSRLYAYAMAITFPAASKIEDKEMMKPEPFDIKQDMKAEQIAEAQEMMAEMRSARGEE
jgi:hypothetical protein